MAKNNPYIKFKLPHRYFIMNIEDTSDTSTSSEDHYYTTDEILKFENFLLIKTDANKVKISMRSSDDPNKTLFINDKKQKWSLEQFYEISKDQANDILKRSYAKTKK